MWEIEREGKKTKAPKMRVEKGRENEAERGS